MIATPDPPQKACGQLPDPSSGRRSLGDYLARKRGNLATQAYLALAKFRENAAPPAAMRILFSERADWETSIRSGFESGPHRISFGPFTPENLRAHDLVVPLTVQDIVRLDSMRGLAAANPLPIPGLASLEICNDKRLFQQTLIAMGFGEYLPPSTPRSRYPYMLKRRVDEWGKSCRIIGNQADEAAHARLIADDGYFSQQYIPGKDEFATHLVFRDGEIIASLNMRYRFRSNSPIKGRDTPLVIHPCRFPYRNLFAGILRSIGFEGLCCFNYKMFDGQPRILEINPRFGGSLGPFFFTFVRDIA